MNEYITPSEIESESMRRIDAGLLERGLHPDDEQLPIIKRVIHATADFDFAESMLFLNDALSKGRAALGSGADILTDTNMALAGIRKIDLVRLHCRAYCHMADEDVIETAKKNGTTRAYVSMEKGAGEAPRGIFACGNAPTALFRLCELMEASEEFRPSLIIGVPVGFVNVVESKERLKEVCERLGIPAIIAMGQKGGSTVCAAILNALLKETVSYQCEV